MEHQDLRGHIPCISIRRTKASQECGQIVGKPRYTVYNLLLTTPPRIRLRARFCSPAMIRRLLLEGMCKRYQFLMEGSKMPTFFVKNGKLKGKLRGWVSGWSLLPIPVPQFPSILPFLPHPFRRPPRWPQSIKTAGPNP